MPLWFKTTGDILKSADAQRTTSIEQSYSLLKYAADSLVVITLSISERVGRLALEAEIADIGYPKCGWWYGEWWSLESLRSVLPPTTFNLKKNVFLTTAVDGIRISHGCKRCGYSRGVTSPTGSDQKWGALDINSMLSARQHFAGIGYPGSDRIIIGPQRKGIMLSAALQACRDWKKKALNSIEAPPAVAFDRSDVDAKRAVLNTADAVIRIWRGNWSETTHGPGDCCFASGVRWVALESTDSPPDANNSRWLAVG